MSSGIPFGNYRLIRRLAAGGMAEVFLATQRGPEGFERTVAVKRILPHLADVPQFVEMFMDEARLAARLSHPNVCHIYEFGQVDGSYFIAMEFVDGMDLSAVILDGERNPLPMEHGARIVADTCAALHHAHHLRGPDGNALGIVHRDISPQNILVSFDGTVKVVDFGIAKAAYHINRTRPGVVRGKYTYMSPEQVDGKKLDGRADIFCAGIVLYELTTGGMLFSRTDALKAMLQIRDGDIPPPRRQGKALPKDLDEIIRKSLSHDPDGRYATGAEMQLALEEYLRACTPTSNSILLGEYFRKHYRKYHPEPILTPEEGNVQRGTRAVDPGPRGTRAVGGSPLGTVAVGDAASGEISDEISGETVVSPARSAPVPRTQARAAATAAASPHLGPLPIEDPMGLLRGQPSVPGVKPQHWTDMVVRPAEPGPGTERGVGSDASLPSGYDPSAMATVSEGGYATIDEGAQTSVDEGDLASEPTLLAATGRTGPASGGFAGRRASMPAPVAPGGSMFDAELYEEQTHEVANAAPISARWARAAGGAPVLAPRGGPFSGSLSPSESLEQLAPPRRGRRSRKLVLGVGLTFLAVAGGVGGYLLADSSPDEGAADAAVSVVQMPRPGDLRAALQPPEPAEAPDRGLAAVAETPDAAAGESEEGLLRVVGSPGNASVSVDGRPAPGETPLQIRVGAGPHTVVVHRAGFEEVTATVTVPGGGSVTHAYRLSREPEQQTVSVRAPGKARRLPKVRRAPPPPRKRPPREVVEAPPPPQGPGYVSVSTIPWSRVYAGSRDLGVTPLANVPLASGQHRLRLVNPTMQEQYVNVTVEPGRTTKVRLQLRPR